MSTRSANILICGYGSAGAYYLDMLLRDENFRNYKIGVMSRSAEKSLPRLELSRVASGILDNYQPIEFIECDFTDHEGMVKAFTEFRPDIIIYTGRFMSGHKYGAYSYPNGIGYGVWVPMSVAYIYRVMKAVKEYESNTDSSVFVVNTSYPDAVNSWLDSVGCAPSTGAGNVNHLIPRVKRAVCELYNSTSPHNLTPDDVDVRMCCSHYSNTYISKEGTTNCSPTILELEVAGVKHHLTDVQREVIYKKCKDTTSSGQVRNLMIASDCYAITKKYLGLVKNIAECNIHLPGPNGLIGGYPCTILDGEVSIEKINGIELSDMYETNVESMKYDGIECIDNSGNITFTDEAINKMKEVFDIDYPKTLNINDAEDFARVISNGLVRYNESKESA